MKTRGHLEVSELWHYARDGKAGLSSNQIDHLKECEDCIGVLGLCRTCKTLDQVQKTIKDEGFFE